MYCQLTHTQAATAIALTTGNVYMYSWEHVPGFSTPCFGVAHTYELMFVWPNLLEFIPYEFTPLEKTLSDTFLDNWTTFAWQSRPAIPKWPQFQNAMNYQVRN